MLAAADRMGAQLTKCQVSGVCQGGARGGGGGGGAEGNAILPVRQGHIAVSCLSMAHQHSRICTGRVHG